MASPQAAHFNTVELGTVSLAQRERAEVPFQDARPARKRRQALHRGLRISIATLVGLAAVLLILTCVHRIGLRRVAGRHAWRRLANSSPGDNPSGDGEQQNNDECEPMQEGEPKEAPSTEETGQEAGSGPLLGEESPHEEAPLGTEGAQQEELPASEPMDSSLPEPGAGAAAPAPSTSSEVQAPPSPPRKRKAKTKHLETSSFRPGSPSSSMPESVAGCLLGAEYFDSLAHDMSNGNQAHAKIGKLEAIQQAADNALSCAENAEGTVSQEIMNSHIVFLGLLSNMFEDEMTRTRILLTETDLGLDSSTLQSVMDNLNQAEDEMRAINDFITSRSPATEGLSPAGQDNAAMSAIAFHAASLELGLNSLEALTDAYEESRTEESRERLDEFIGIVGSFGGGLRVLLEWMGNAGLEGPRQVLLTYERMLENSLTVARERLNTTYTSPNVSPIVSPVRPMSPVIPFETLSGFTVISPAGLLQQASVGLRSMMRQHRSSPTAASHAQITSQINLSQVLISDAQQQVSEGHIPDHVVPEVIGCICELTDTIKEAQEMLDRS
ncbi:hypothetical protein, conserved [Eimeria necatrix]|uniref:Uncharacterized protein n=1 Tax=Eimeria necatrix TaxID=51315 RepID=U6MEC4_9EIME|nr:hypothetical protein, conserved [Eimeria necatrix]CDJ62562.1 hypothetical protein, conserved [Eimeria necatrix]